MEKSLFAILLFILPYTNHAQTQNVDWGEKYSYQGRKFGNALYYNLLGHSDQHYYTLHGTNKSREILQYDFDHKLIKVTPANYISITSVSSAKMINTASGDFLISKYFNQKELTWSSTPIGQEGNVAKWSNHFYSHEYKVSRVNTLGDKINKDTYGIALSADSSKVIIGSPASRKDRGKKGSMEKYFIAVFDDQMKKLWDTQVDFQEEDKNIFIQQFHVSNTGEAFLLLRQKNPEKRKRWHPEFDYYLYKIERDGSIQKTEILLGDEFVRNAYLYMHPDGNFYVMGYFTDREKRKVFLRREHGVFLIRYDSKGEEVFKKKHRWKDQFYQGIKDYRKRLEPRVILAGDITIDEVYFDAKQNSLTFLSEFRAFSKKPDRFGDYEYHGHFLIIPSFDLEGNLRWTSSVSKSIIKESLRLNIHHTKNYISSYKDGNIYIAFEDEKNRKERKAYPKKTKGSTIFTDLVRINSEGKKDFEQVLFTSRETGVDFKASRSFNLGNGRLLLYGRNTYNALCGILDLTGE